MSALNRVHIIITALVIKISDKSSWPEFIHCSKRWHWKYILFISHRIITRYLCLTTQTFVFIGLNSLQGSRPTERWTSLPTDYFTAIQLLQPRSPPPPPPPNASSFPNMLTLNLHDVGDLFWIQNSRFFQKVTRLHACNVLCPRTAIALGPHSS